MPVAQMNLGMFFQIPVVRQVMLLVGVAASVAAGFAVVLWAQTPGHVRLYEGLDGSDVAEIADALRAADIDFNLNMETGTVTVPESILHDARLELASQGLPNGAAVGMRSLAEQPTFGQSQFRETAMYQHALEGELAKTIAHLGAVRDARVHLALPRQRTFIRDRETASASVMLNLYRGRELEEGQVASIVHFVASSVPNLAIGDVTVVDQMGRLLSSGDDAWNDALTAKQFQIAERLEQNYKRRIETLLTPLLGPGRVRAEVAADMDFTFSEEMRESFDPNGAMVSEYVSENQRSGGSAVAGGIPGALTNQPPQAVDSATATATATADADQADQAPQPMDTSSSSTRNFEVDRTISHTKPQAGRIRRLSVAVLVNDAPTERAEGAAASTLSAEDIDRVTTLVKEAVGFDAERGDTVSVVHAAFKDVPEAEPAVAPPFWKQPTFFEILKITLGAGLVLALAFGVVRPMLRSLLAANGSPSRSVISGFGAASAAHAQAVAPVLPTPSFDEKVAAAKNISGHDPARVAQVVKQWVGAPPDA